MFSLGEPQFEYLADNPFLVQRQVALAEDQMAHMRERRCRIIHDIDDLLWEIPVDNPNVHAHGSELLDDMKRAMRSADLVTAATEPLAEALGQIGISAVVVNPNLLDPVDWRMMPKRAERKRLRIGWYGQRNVHIEDLNVIEAVVRTLAHEVDFVFYGDLPHGLSQVQSNFEVYAATSIELFPTMLALLDLDILLSPLAKNRFNECKSNLRLLQAGLLGYAVIATDIEPHRTLPVTRVANKPGIWIRAIRDRIGQIEAVRAEGRLLESAVRERYTINEASSARLFEQWTGRAPILN
jgi:hypothetical protein